MGRQLQSIPGADFQSAIDGVLTRQVAVTACCRLEAHGPVSRGWREPAQEWARLFGRMTIAHRSRCRQASLRTSMLSGVQEHPHPSRRRSGQQAREYSTATHARVVLFDCRVFHATAAIERQRVVRLGMGWLPIKIRARRAWLNPEFHSSSRQMCCIAGPRPAKQLCGNTIMKAARTGQAIAPRLLSKLTPPSASAASEFSGEARYPSRRRRRRLSTARMCG